MQAVPSSPNLYRNSFTYETVKDLPPDFAACNKFIGEQELSTRQQLRFQCPGFNPCAGPEIVSVSFRRSMCTADTAREARTKVLVHCMSGITR